MRRHKIVEINVGDIVVDPAAQSEMLTAACGRGAGAVLTGLCQVGDDIIVSLEILDGEEANGDQPEECVFSPFASENEDEIVTEIGTRFFSGFSFVGGFYVGRTLWGLFRRTLDEKERLS